MKHKNSQGFSHILVPILVLIAVAIIFTGFRVYKEGRSKDSSAPANISSHSAPAKGLEEAGIKAEDNPDLGVVIPSTDDSEVSSADGAKTAKLSIKEAPAYSSFMVNIPPNQATVTKTLLADVKGINISSCTINHKTVQDDSTGNVTNDKFQAAATQAVSMVDGTHTYTLLCDSGGELTSTVTIVAADGKPERCNNFTFSNSEISITSLANLRSGIVGTWKGCVATPWLPPYDVTITFNNDGSYSAISTEKLDGMEMNALYYGMEEDDILKRYELNSCSAEGLGTGQIDIVFDFVRTVNKDDLRNIRLMGNKLSFDMYHHSTYGPLTFQLYKQ